MRAWAALMIERWRVAFQQPGFCSQDAKALQVAEFCREAFGSEREALACFENYARCVQAGGPGATWRGFTKWTKGWLKDQRIYREDRQRRANRHNVEGRALAIPQAQERLHGIQDKLRAMAAEQRKEREASK